MSFDRATRDDASSIYSRSTDSPKLVTTQQGSYCLAAKHDLPEINTLDHQIAMLRGSTIALETTSVRLQKSKTQRRRSLPESRCEKLRQWEKQNYENEFYQACLENFQELLNTVVAAIRVLTPNPYYETEGMKNVHMVVNILHEKLRYSRFQEAQAEQTWRSRWNSSNYLHPQSNWI